ncbi:hypothetical protein PVAND_008977 [Polypedilum vanderplanki]|uniref:Tubulin polymerization-promoting protein homolog n=1 Tax=Polypedilum vanderplanki TaxID=319348 RepID=A0A9J6CBH3_POLVA|nr:hypothetical protein PVAND_008977 [Polypedilum vanderplanki]
MNFICDLCQNTFNGKGYLLRHMERFHLKFSCAVCNQIYSQKKNFLDHLRSHFEKLICNYCGIRIYKKEKLEQHVLLVHEPSKRQYNYSCRFCERKFPNAVFRNCHERDVHRGREESAFKCKYCKQSFLKRDQLRLHTLENHYSGSIFFCSHKECDRYFKTSKLLKTHEKIHGPAGYKCKSCNKTFQQSSNFSKHKKRCKGPVKSKIYTEEELEKNSNIAKEQFLIHGGKLRTNIKTEEIKVKENKIKESNGIKNKIDQKVKSKIVQISQKIKEHKKSKNLKRKKDNKIKKEESVNEINSDETICDLCGIKIDSLANLRKHMITNHKETQFPCTEMNCNLVFNLKGNLKKHIKQVHDQERPFQCDICGISLKTKNHLVNHLKIHENPKKCPICSIILPNIDAHIKRHKQVKSTFTCSQCNRECATKQALNEHIQRIHERKPLGKFYSCSVCDENFIRNSDLRRHSFIHYQDIQPVEIMAEAPVKEVAAMSITSTKEPAANGSAPNAEASPGSPAPDSGNSSFKEQFKAFSKFGDVKSDGKFITLSQSDKWMKQAHVIDKKITTTDTGIHFKKLKSLKVSILDYNKFLEDLAKTKGVDLSEIKNKMANCGAPGATTVKASPKAAETVARLTDTSKYTGSHKQRFDETGKGKGIAGRKDVPSVTNYSRSRSKFKVSCLNGLSNTAVIKGSKGQITIPTFWCPLKIIDIDGSIKTWELPKGRYEFNLLNSAGLSFEAEDTRQLINAGIMESPTVTHEESLRIARVQDKLRKQLGVHFPEDDMEY